MNRRILIFFVFYFLLFAIGLSAQNTWVQTYDPFYEAVYHVEDIIVCSDGGYAINGYYFQDTPLERGYLIKTDEFGNLEWARMDTVSFQGWNHSNAILSVEDGIISASYLFIGETAIIKRDLSGNRAWSKPLEWIYIRSLSTTNDGCIIASGYDGFNNENWPTLAKLNSEGDLIWYKDFEFSDYSWGAFNSVNQSSDGGFLISGILYSQIDFFDVLVIKTNSVGDSLWSRIYSNPNEISEDEGLTIVEVDEENILVGGNFFDLANYTHKGFLWKLDSQGNTLWMDTEVSNCGYSQNSLTNVDDTTILSVGLDVGSNHTIRKFNSDLELEWISILPYYSSNGDKSVKVALDDNIVIAQCTPQYPVIVKINSDGTIIDKFIIDVPEILFNAFPNPFNPTTTIEFSIQNNSNVELSIFNIKGQKIKTLTNNDFTKGNHSIIWNGDDNFGKAVSSGIYYYKLNINGKTEAGKKCLLMK